jgi:hypothetical protein
MLDWFPIVLILVLIPSAAWTLFSLMRSGATRSSEFDTLAGFFAILAATYLGLHGLRGIAWTSVTTLYTFNAAIGILIAPLMMFANGLEAVDASYTKAMLLSVIGLGSFWIGCLLCKRRLQPRFVPRYPGTPPRVEFGCVVLLVIGTAGNLALWKLGLLGLEKEMNVGAPFLQWLVMAAGMLTSALVVSCIELFGKQGAPFRMKILAGLSFSLSTAFGIISGYKGNSLFPLIWVFFIYAVTRAKLPRMSLIVPLILVVFIYPFEEAYRSNLTNGGYRDQVNTVGGQVQTLARSFNDAFLSFGSGSSSAGRQSTEAASVRLSRLSFIRDVVNLPAPSMLAGDEQLWLAPIYPLIPRFIWKNKPVFDKGVRLSIVLGRGDQTSSAPTMVGDLYATYGTYGVAIGMFLLGIGLQIYMNWYWNTPITERRLLIYMVMLLGLINFESDVVGYIVAIVQWGIVYLLISYAIYGWPTSRVAMKERMT